MVGLTAQVVFALLVLRWSVGKDVLDFAAGQVEALIGCTDAGIKFLFGPLVADKKQTIFALQVLPVIIFIGALVGLLYYVRVIQWIVEIVGGAISWAMRTTKVESLYAATVIFLGVADRRAVGRGAQGGHLHRREAGAERVRGVLRLRPSGEVALPPDRRRRHLRAGGLRELRVDRDQIGAIGGLAPERRGEVAKLGLKALLAGTLVNLANATIAGVVAT